MIEIELRLFGDLKRFLKDLQIYENRLTQFNDDSTIRDTINTLGIPIDEARIILVNGRPCELDVVLQDGDRLAIFPMIVGG